MRYSNNVEVKGIVKDGFDYSLQFWIEDYIVQNCGHTNNFRARRGGNCCNGFKYAGQDIRQLLHNKI